MLRLAGSVRHGSLLDEFPGKLASRVREHENVHTGRDECATKLEIAARECLVRCQRAGCLTRSDDGANRPLDRLLYLRMSGLAAISHRRCQIRRADEYTIDTVDLADRL